MSLKLGKLPPKPHPKTILFSSVLQPNLPPAPPKAFYEYKVPVGQWGMFDNDKYGCCTCAGPAHEIMNRTAHTGTLVIPTEQDVLNMYEAICPGFDPSTDANDNGAAITDALSYLMTHGLAGHKIDGWAQIDQSNAEHVKLAIAIFGSINVGVNLPQSAEGQFADGQPWNVVPDDGGNIGGHCIPILGYGSEGLTCVTWAKLQQMSWAWFLRYCDEAYVEMSLSDWVFTSGNTPSGVDVATLRSVLAGIKS